MEIKCGGVSVGDLARMKCVTWMEAVLFGGIPATASVQAQLFPVVPTGHPLTKQVATLLCKIHVLLIV
jgi:hypothetical protein